MNSKKMREKMNIDCESNLQKGEHFLKMNNDRIRAVVPFYRCVFHSS